MNPGIPYLNFPSHCRSCWQFPWFPCWLTKVWCFPVIAFAARVYRIDSCIIHRFCYLNKLTSLKSSLNFISLDLFLYYIVLVFILWVILFIAHSCLKLQAVQVGWKYVAGLYRFSYLSFPLWLVLDISNFARALRHIFRKRSKWIRTSNQRSNLCCLIVNFWQFRWCPLFHLRAINANLLQACWRIPWQISRKYTSIVKCVILYSRLGGLGRFLR